ncbi:hypothetical protein ACLMJK_002904 [Lecanora helva]
MHPRLLSTLLLVEPVIFGERAGGPNPALLSTIRRDVWNSREQAEKSLRKGLSSWDERSLDKFLKYGLRAVPTKLHSPEHNAELPPSAVTLATSKHQEAWAYSQINFGHHDSELDRLILPDWDPRIGLPYLAYRPECVVAMRNLPQVRPSVLYIFGATSPLSPPKYQEQKLNQTGTGLGGSGGAAEGRVEKIVLQRTGHLVLFEKIDACAEASANWIHRWFHRWLADEEILRNHKSEKSDDANLRMTDAWIKAVKLPVDTLRGKL